MAKEQLRFTGSGGQGVILGTIIIAEAAFLDGKKGRSISIPTDRRPEAACARLRPS